jgi:hypothetical protein
MTGQPIIRAFGRRSCGVQRHSLRTWERPPICLIRIKAAEHADRIVNTILQEPKGSHHERYDRTDPVSAAPQ